MRVHKEAFGGCRMALRRLKDMGIVPYDDCSKVLFPPEGTQESVVRSVIRGVADVGTVRTGIIEGLIRKGEMAAGDVRIIGPVEDDFPFPHFSPHSSHCFPMDFVCVLTSNPQAGCLNHPRRTSSIKGLASANPQMAIFRNLCVRFGF